MVLHTSSMQEAEAGRPRFKASLFNTGNFRSTKDKDSQRNGRGEKHFKNHKNGCLCVRVGREWFVCISLKSKNVINTEKN